MHEWIKRTLQPEVVAGMLLFRLGDYQVGVYAFGADWAKITQD